MLWVTDQSGQNTVDLVYKIYIYLDFGGQLLVMLPVKLRFTKKNEVAKSWKVERGRGSGFTADSGPEPVDYYLC